MVARVDLFEVNEDTVRWTLIVRGLFDVGINIRPDGYCRAELKLLLPLSTPAFLAILNAKPFPELTKLVIHHRNLAC